MPGNTYRSNYVSYTDHTGYINNYASGQILTLLTKIDVIHYQKKLLIF